VRKTHENMTIQCENVLVSTEVRKSPSLQATEAREEVLQMSAAL